METRGLRPARVAGFGCVFALGILVGVLVVKEGRDIAPPSTLSQLPSSTHWNPIVRTDSGQPEPSSPIPVENRIAGSQTTSSKRPCNGEKPWLRVDHSRCPPHKPEDLNDYGQSIRSGDPCFCPTPGGEVIRETPFGRIIGLRNREDEPLSRITLDSKRPGDEGERFALVDTLMRCASGEDAKDGLFILLGEFDQHPDSPALKEGVSRVLQSHPASELRVAVFAKALSRFDPTEGAFNDSSQIANHTYLLEQGLKVLPQDPDPACRLRFLESLTPSMDSKKRARTEGNAVKPLKWALPVVQQMAEVDQHVDVRAAAQACTRAIEEYLKRYQ